MTCSWASGLGAALLGSALWAGPAVAQSGTEWGMAATGVASDPVAGTGGVLLGRRLAPRGRLQLQAGLGRQGRALAWRGELVGHFLLSPRAQQRPALYGGGGIAVAGAGRSDGYLVLVVGIEQGPAGRGGWFVEGGVGGGARVSVGYRWRRWDR